MTHSLPFRTSVVALVITAAAHLATAPAADDPKAAPADPLPQGATVQLGSTKFVFRFSPGFTPLPPDFRTLAVSGPGDGLQRYDLASGQPLGKGLDPVAVGGGQIVMSADGSRYTVYRTGIVTIRETATGKPVQQIKRPEGFSTTFTSGTPAVAMSADGKVFAQGSQDKEKRGDVTVWDVDRNEILFHTGTLQTRPVIPVLSADGKLLATRGYGFGVTPPNVKPEDDPARVIQVWGVAEKKELFQAKLTPAAGYQITAAAFSPDNGLLAASVGDGTIDWWDVRTGKAKPPLLGRSGQGVRLAFSPDGKTLASVGVDGSIQRWAAADGKLLGVTDPPDSLPQYTAQGFAFAGNDRVLAWGAAGVAPVVWEAPSGKLLTPLPEHTLAIKSVAFAAGGKELLTAGFDGRLVRWDAATGKPLGAVALRQNRGFASYRPLVNLSPDGTRGVVEGQGWVFDLKTGAEEFSLPRGPSVGHNTNFLTSPDLTKAIVTAVPYDRKQVGTCAVWDLVTQRKVGEVELSAAVGYTPAVAVSPSGTRLVTAAFAPDKPFNEQTLVITGWDLKTGKKLGVVEDTKALGNVAVAAAGEGFAVVATSNGRLRAYDFEAGKGGDEFDLGGPRADAAAGPVVFSPDRKRFAVGLSGDKPGVYGVKVYDWPNGTVLHTFLGHTAPVGAVTFSPDGKSLATGSQDTTVLVWKLDDAN